MLWVDDQFRTSSTGCYRTPEHWAEQIRERWQDNVKSIFEVALMLDEGEVATLAPSLDVSETGRANSIVTRREKVRRRAADLAPIFRHVLGPVDVQREAMIAAARWMVAV